MKMRLVLWAMAGIFPLAGLNLGAQDLDSPRGPTRPVPVKRNDPALPATPVMQDTQLVEKLRAAGANLSAPVLEIVRMSEAGTEPAVIQTFVENSTMPVTLKAEEIIYLHDHGVSPSIITAIIHRGTKLHEQLAAAQANSAYQAAVQSPPAADASAYNAVQPLPPAYPSPAYYPNYAYVDPGYYYAPLPSFGLYFPRPFYFGHSYGHGSYGRGFGGYGRGFGGGHQFSRGFSSGRSFGGRR